MVKATVEEMEGKLYPSASEIHNGLQDLNASGTNYISLDPTEAKIMIGTVLAFYTGIIQVILIRSLLYMNRKMQVNLDYIFLRYCLLYFTWVL